MMITVCQKAGFTGLRKITTFSYQSDDTHICAMKDEMRITVCQKDGFTWLRKITTFSDQSDEVQTAR